MTTTSNGIKKDTKKQPVAFSRIYKSDFQKEGTKTLEVKQAVETVSIYPSKKTESSAQQNIFDNSEYGFEPQIFTSTETRVAWLVVPEGMADSVIMERLEAHIKGGATLYRVLSNEPILDENQVYAINAGLRTKDMFADKMIVRVPENEETLKNGTANTIALDPAGRVQYRKVYFWRTDRADIDLRGEKDAEGNVKEYRTAGIIAELANAGVLQGQTI